VCPYTNRVKDGEAYQALEVFLTLWLDGDCAAR